MTIALDVTITQKLKNEGVARELVNEFKTTEGIGLEVMTELIFSEK